MFLINCILVLLAWQPVSSVANRAKDKEDMDLEAGQEVEVNFRDLQCKVGVRLRFSL